MVLEVVQRQNNEVRVQAVHESVAARVGAQPLEDLVLALPRLVARGDPKPLKVGALRLEMGVHGGVQLPHKGRAGRDLHRLPALPLLVHGLVAALALLLHLGHGRHAVERDEEADRTHQRHVGVDARADGGDERGLETLVGRVVFDVPHSVVHDAVRVQAEIGGLFAAVLDNHGLVPPAKLRKVARDSHFSFFLES